MLVVLLRFRWKWNDCTCHSRRALGFLSPSGPRTQEVGLTSQGSAHGRFTRAIQQRSLFGAEMAAREMGGLPLASALDLVVLLRRSRSVLKLLLCAGMELELEASTLRLEESQFALAEMWCVVAERGLAARAVPCSYTTTAPTATQTSSAKKRGRKCLEAHGSSCSLHSPA
jgi:hypothetical protein